jgi:hypothetical protein
LKKALFSKSMRKKYCRIMQYGYFGCDGFSFLDLDNHLSDKTKRLLPEVSREIQDNGIFDERRLRILALSRGLESLSGGNTSCTIRLATQIEF